MNSVFIGLVLMDALAIWAIILSKRAAWWLVLLAIIAMSSFNFLTINAFNSGTGWPVKQVPSGSNAFVACDVVEPGADTQGAIYLYLVPLTTRHHFLGYTAAAQTPKSFQERFTRQLESQCVKATKQASQGVPTLVTAKPRSKSKHTGSGKSFRGSLNFRHFPPSNPAKPRG